MTAKLPSSTPFPVELLPALGALLTERHVTRAGVRVGLSQPAMSAQLRRIRQHFNDRILVRTGREYALTPMAQSLRDPVARILRDIGLSLSTRDVFDPATSTRSFVIGASDYATLLLAAPLLERLSRDAPGIRLHFRPIVGDLEAMLELAGGVELLVLPATFIRTPRPNVPLFSDRFVAAVWVGHPTVDDSLSVDQLAQLPSVEYRLGSRILSLADQAVEDQGMTRSVEVTVETFFAAPFLIRGTRCVAFIPERLGMHLKDAAEIKMIDSPIPFDPLVEHLFWNPFWDADDAHRWLRTQIADVAAQL